MQCSSSSSSSIHASSSSLHHGYAGAFCKRQKQHLNLYLMVRGRSMDEVAAKHLDASRHQRRQQHPLHAFVHAHLLWTQVHVPHQGCTTTRHFACVRCVTQHALLTHLRTFNTPSPSHLHPLPPPPHNNTTTLHLPYQHTTNTDVQLELNPDQAAKDVLYDETNKTVRIPLAALTDGQRRTKMVMFTCNKCGELAVSGVAS